MDSVVISIILQAFNKSTLLQRWLKNAIDGENYDHIEDYMEQLSDLTGLHKGFIILNFNEIVRLQLEFTKND